LAVGTEETTSSSKVEPDGDDGGMIVYVMRTFLAERHMERVECVTDQVPCSHSNNGALKEGEGPYLSGERS
jgi:hypothetical protein